MANAFSPDVGVDIGASNVTPRSSRSIDFSGLSNIFGSSTGDKPSESEIQDVLLEPYVKDLQLISQVPDTIKRETYFRQAELNALQANPGYDSEISRIAERFRKNTEPVPGSTPSLAAISYNDFLKTDAGKSAAYNAAQNNRNPDGSIDETAAYQEVVTRSFDYFKTQEKYADLKTKTENKKMTSDMAFADFIPTRSAEVNKEYDDFFQNTELVRAGFDPKGTTEDTLAAKMQLEQWVNGKKAEDTQMLAAMGVDVNSPNFKLDPIYAVVESKIKTLEAVLTYPETLKKELSEEASAVLVMRINKLGRPELTATFASKEGESAFFAEQVAMFKDELSKAGTSERTTAAEEALQMRTIFLPLALATGSEPMTPATGGNVSDLGRQQASLALAEFDPKQVESFRMLPEKEQASSLKTALNSFDIITPDKITNPIAATAVRKTQLSEAYLGLSFRSNFNYVDNTKMQKYYGDSSFNVAKKISEQAPAEGTLLYKQMNKAMSTEVKRIETRLIQNITSMQFPSDRNPLVFKEVGNRIVIGLNPTAVSTDPDLQMTLRMIRNGMQNEQAMGYSIITDPHFESKEAEAFVSQYNSMLFSKGSDMLDLMRNINLLNTQFDKMPDEIKNDPAYGKIGIRAMLAALPTYTVQEGGTN